MNILFRHTLSSVTRNPVQSLIVVASAAMITACMLLCLCISSFFEYSAALWAENYYVGAEMIIHTSRTHEDEVEEWFDAHSEDIEAVSMTAELTLAASSDTATVQVMNIFTDLGGLDGFDAVIGAEILERTENTTSLPSAHISQDSADILGVSLGDTFKVKGEGEFFVEAIAANTKRYYGNPTPVVVCETDMSEQTSLRYCVWFKDAYGTAPDGRENIEVFSGELAAITGNVSGVQATARDYLADGQASVENSMQLISIAAAVITVVMACLLYSSFSVIVRGRVNELVKFKAAGATPAQSAFILLVEAALYSVIGGLLGLGVGEGIIALLNSMTATAVSVIIPGAADYILALMIGAACGIASCVIPAARMSARSIQSLLGGDERMHKPVRLPIVLVIAALTLAFSVAMFFLPVSARVPVSMIALVLIFLSAVLLSPWVLRGVCALSKRLTRPSAAYISECALPRSASVNSAYTMLVALIAFIWLGSCLIDVVKITSYPSSARYDCDFVARITDGTLTDDEAEAELERCLAIDGITDGMLMRVTGNTRLAYPDGTIVGANIADAVIQTIALEKGEDIRYCVEVPISDEVVRRFDELLAEGGHPVIVTRHVADKYRFAVGSTMTIIADTILGQRRLVDDFTVVGIDETATSWDDIVFISATDLAAEDVGILPCSYRMQLNGDTSRFAELREQVDTENVTFYTREGYFPAESAASVDDSDKMLSVFSVIIYIIAAMGLANLVVITAGERRRELDILRLAGMTPQDAAKAVLAETALLSLSGFAAGLIIAFFANASTVAIAQIANRYILLDPFPLGMLAIAGIGAGIFALLWALSHFAAFAQISSKHYRTRDDRSLRAN